MKRILSFVLILLACALEASADHITGGEMSYSYEGQSSGIHHYNVLLKFYMRCNSPRTFNDPTIISVFDKRTNTLITTFDAPLTGQETISLPNNNPCITNPPQVCYLVGYYYFSLALPSSPRGYIISSLVNFRIAGISNLVAGYGQIGATYIAEIPGNDPVSNAPQNNSARFTGSDLVVVCAQHPFTYSFGAEDADGDGLRYSFCAAYQSGTREIGSAPLPPPYSSVPYGPGYGSTAPLGGSVQINEATGLITGIAPEAGIYVVTVCVEEIRNGSVIATQRKDLQINIASCNIAAAGLEPEYLLCGNSQTLTLSNLASSPLIRTYAWELADVRGSVLLSSADPTVTHTFRDTGLYLVKLAINRGEECSDSTTSLVKVYPGFHTAFTAKDVCLAKPTQFTDASTSRYGTLTSWSWNFGEPSGAGSDEQHPSFTYPTTGSRTVVLTATDSRGCRDTAVRTVSIVDKPPLSLAFRDTLICVNDAVQLEAVGSGTLSWSPTTAMSNGSTANPVVTPRATTTYVVQQDDNGCLNQDSVRVRVVDHVSLQAMEDTTICLGDTLRLRAATDGLRYSWTPAEALDDPAALNPLVGSGTTATYHIRASIGGCSTTDEVVVTAVPYPVIRAGADTTICYGTGVQLNCTTDGSTISWAPEESLSSATVLTPLAHPEQTTTYLLEAYDTRGCPKPGRDTVVVRVLPPISADAGGDTAVVVGQTVQLAASGGVAYAWSPPTALSATDVPTPVAVYEAPSEGIRYKVLVYNEAGCADSTFKTVRVFKTGATVFVPTAFTPNGDGRNDVLRPIAAGMTQVEYFRVFNRWGQLVFHTTRSGHGWDGTIGGREQGAGVYVWEVKAIDYQGSAYTNKGTVVLLR